MMPTRTPMIFGLIACLCLFAFQLNLKTNSEAEANSQLQAAAARIAVLDTQLDAQLSEVRRVSERLTALETKNDTDRTWTQGTLTLIERTVDEIRQNMLEMRDEGDKLKTDFTMYTSTKSVVADTGTGEYSDCDGRCDQLEAEIKLLKADLAILQDRVTTLTSFSTSQKTASSYPAASSTSSGNGSSGGTMSYAPQQNYSIVSHPPQPVTVYEAPAPYELPVTPVASTTVTYEYECVDGSCSLKQTASPSSRISTLMRSRPRLFGR